MASILLEHCQYAGVNGKFLGGMQALPIWKNLFASLLGSVVFSVAGQRSDYSDLIVREELRQIFMALFEEDDQIAAVYNSLTHGSSLDGQAFSIQTGNMGDNLIPISLAYEPLLLAF
jgi:hypothetical protein